MEVLGVGNVRSCNEKWIFLADDTRERSTKEKLEEILLKAEADVLFYTRMSTEIREYYTKRYEEVSSKYSYITEEDVKKAFKENRRKGLELSWDQERNNTECVKAYSECYGISSIMNEILDKIGLAEKLLRQAESALKRL